MKKLILKATAVASLALLHGMTLAAAIDLDATSPVSRKFASEQTITTSIALVHNGATSADLSATVVTGATLPVDTAAYIRFDLSSGTFTANPTMTVQDSTPGGETVAVAQGGAGQSYVIFSVTPSAGNSLVSTGAAVMTPTSITVTNQNTVTLTYKLFETLTNAANSTLPLKTTTKNYIAFQGTTSTTVTGATKTADVAASPAYTGFTSATAPLATVVVADTGTMSIAAGTAATAATVVSGGVPTVDGDFTSFVNDDGTYTGGALNRVFLSNSGTCATTDLPATALTATKATFASIAGAALAATRYLCVTAEGTPVITAGSYTMSIDYTGVAGFVVTDVAAVAAGSIVRNGTNLVAPLVQTPGTYLARLVLSNSGTVARTYTVRAISETGTTVTLSGAAAAGTLGANSTTVVDLPALLAGTGFTGATRGTLLVTVNGPSSAIDGLYQITNPTTGAISNHALILK